MPVKETSKVCFKCGKNKPLSMFYKHPQMADGHLNKCKECTKKDVSGNYRENIDHYKMYEASRIDNPTRRQFCKEKSERDKERYKTDPGFKNSIISNKEKWLDKNPHKRLAHFAVNNAVRDGKLFKPTSCGKCGKSDCKIYGHHWSYLPEHYLDVLWVCASCHGKEHRKLKIEQLHEPCLEPAQ